MSVVLFAGSLRFERWRPAHVGTGRSGWTGRGERTRARRPVAKFNRTEGPRAPPLASPGSGDGSLSGRTGRLGPPQANRTLQRRLGRWTERTAPRDLPTRDGPMQAELSIAPHRARPPNEPLERQARDPPSCPGVSAQEGKPCATAPAARAPGHRPRRQRPVIARLSVPGRHLPEQLSSAAYVSLPKQTVANLDSIHHPAPRLDSSTKSEHSMMRPSPHPRPTTQANKGSSTPEPETACERSTDFPARFP